MLYSRNVLMFGIYLMSAFVIKYSTDVHRLTHDRSAKLYTCITYKFINNNTKQSQITVGNYLKLIEMCHYLLS